MHYVANSHHCFFAIAEDLPVDLSTIDGTVYDSAEEMYAAVAQQSGIDVEEIRGAEMRICRHEGSVICVDVRGAVQDLKGQPIHTYISEYVI